MSDIAITTDGVYFQSMLYIPETGCSPEGIVDCTSDFWKGKCINGKWVSLDMNSIECGYKPGTEVTTETLILPGGEPVQVNVPVGQEPPTVEEFLAGTPGGVPTQKTGGGVPLYAMVGMIGILGVAMIVMQTGSRKGGVG